MQLSSQVHLRRSMSFLKLLIAKYSSAMVPRAIRGRARMSISGLGWGGC